MTNEIKKKGLLLIIFSFINCGFEKSRQYMYNKKSAPFPKNINPSQDGFEDFIMKDLSQKSKQKNDSNNTNNRKLTPEQLLKIAKKTTNNNYFNSKNSKNKRKKKEINVSSYSKTKLNSIHKKLYFKQTTDSNMFFLNNILIKDNPTWSKPIFLIYKNRTPALFFTLEFLFYSNFKLANNYYASNLSDGRLFGTKNGNRPSKLKDYSEIGKDKDRGTKLNLKDYKFEISKYEFEEIFNILSCSNIFPQELCYTILSFLCDYSRINFYFKYVPKSRKEIKIFFREQASKKHVSTKEIKIPIVF